MEQNEYKMGQMKQNRPVARGPMGGRSMGGGEKPKDFIGTWKKLLGYCKKYLAVIVIAILCATVGTVCTLAGSDKLSDMTDAVTDGIAPDTDKLEEITTAMSDNLSENMQTVMTAIAGNMADPQNMQPEITVNDVSISAEDQMAAMQLLGSVDQKDADAMQTALKELPDSVQDRKSVV